MILGIETATQLLSVALLEGDRLRGAVTIDRPNAHDELLAPLCRDLLRHCGAVPEDLRAVAVSAGPGSFTGLRIGMAVAKGMALSLHIPLAAVPTPDAVAAGMVRLLAPAQDTAAAVFLPARRGEVYAACYTLRPHCAERNGDIAVLSETEAAEKIVNGLLIAGDAAEHLLSLPATGAGLLLRQVQADARDVAALGADMIADGNAADPASCEPIYIQEFEVRQGKNPLTRP